MSDRSAARAFWSATLDGVDAPTSPAIAGAATPGAPRGRTQRALGPALRAFAGAHELAVDTVVAGAWAIVLAAYAGTDDVVFGAAIADATVPLRVRIPGGALLVPWLTELAGQRARAQAYACWPLDDIAGWADLAPGLPLFETSIGDAAATTALHLHIDDATCALTYDASRFAPDAIDRMLASLAAVFDALPTARCVADLPLLAPAELATQVVAWNRTHTAPPARCVHDRFAAQAAATPDAIALVHGAETVTYRALDERANQLAHALRASGRAGARIGIYLPRSPAMIVAMLGVLKAGAAYVPFDPALPHDVLRPLLADAGIAALITDADLAADAPPRLRLDDPALADQPRHAVDAEAALGDVAYLIYTSGSTGSPRGVIVAHRSLASFVGHAIAEYALTARDRVLQFASISFDTSVEEIYPILLTGGTLVLRSDAMLGSVTAFLRACRDAAITVLDLPTAYWHVLVDGLASAHVGFPPELRLVIIGGERAKPAQVATWFRLIGSDTAPRVVLANTYGPTEGTVCATACVLAPDDGDVPIGKPIRDVEVFVLDRRGQPVPIGVPGELHLAGAGVAYGYLGRAGHTAERFVPNPFATRAGERMYRTGDLVKYQADGSLLFVGRVDHQIKFRGYRIELQEIEIVLARHADVAEAVVLLDDARPDHPRLVAFVTLAPQRTPTVAELRDHLRARLPAHMVPSAITVLAALPLTARGKLDRRALTRTPRQP